MGNSKSSKSMDVTAVPKKTKEEKKIEKSKAANPGKGTGVSTPTTVSIPATVTTTSTVDSTPAAVTSPAVISTPAIVTSPATDSTPATVTSPAIVLTPTTVTSPAANSPPTIITPVSTQITSLSTTATVTSTAVLTSAVTSENDSVTITNAAAKVAASKMPLTLYHLGQSPPCRAIRMTAKVLGIDLNLKMVDLQKGEHKTPEYTKLNPTQSVPTLDDNGFILCESRAILTYMVDAYSKNDSLYPKNPKARAAVDQRLYFDIGTFYQSYLNYYIRFVLYGKPLIPENLPSFEKSMGLLNTFLEGHKYVAGDHLTIADISIIPTISNIEMFDFDLSQYPNVYAWYMRTKEALKPYGYEEINQAGAEIFRQMYKSRFG